MHSLSQACTIFVQQKFQNLVKKNVIHFSIYYVDKFFLFSQNVCFAQLFENIICSFNKFKEKSVVHNNMQKKRYKSMYFFFLCKIYLIATQYIMNYIKSHKLSLKLKTKKKQRNYVIYQINNV